MMLSIDPLARSLVFNALPVDSDICDTVAL